MQPANRPSAPYVYIPNAHTAFEQSKVGRAQRNLNSFNDCQEKISDSIRKGGTQATCGYLTQEYKNILIAKDYRVNNIFSDRNDIAWGKKETKQFDDLRDV